MNKIGVLVVDHGSRRQAANDMIFDVAAKLQARLPEFIVRGVHMEIAEPTIMDGFADLVSKGATEIRVIPFMLSPGRHSTEDIPNLVADAAAAHGDIAHSVTAHFGEDDLVTDILLKRAQG